MLHDKFNVQTNTYSHCIPHIAHSFFCLPGCLTKTTTKDDPANGSDPDQKARAGIYDTPAISTNACFVIKFRIPCGDDKDRKRTKGKCSDRYTA